MIPTSPSHAFKVPISSAKGRPEEKPKPSIHPALRVESATRSSASPLGRGGFSASAGVLFWALMAMRVWS
ncbi:hypothetical protein [Novosphingobium sp. KACC 22771]|uniref:hypothetical protein n=1 Tax=Novosphingobium sp. KACC 22771 TaxID=3025670 RepID=UPI00236668F9|nr:hypothetical protein [Novosphingobium sp. KACC 22771]WDF74199.1 hypothetical protein PQ467_07340 [Novosphingobium sp. KACC 22771]